MRNPTMTTDLSMRCATQLSMRCATPYPACASRPAPRAKVPLRTRLATLAIALAALYVMFNGERWMLEHPPAAANELVVATCALDVVFGDAGPTSLCTSAVPGNDKESAR
jgi:hypothetical protein